MPKYEVIAPGFYGGVTYDPHGKRSTLTTEKPLKPVPSWLKPHDEKAVKPAAKAAATVSPDAATVKAELNEPADISFAGGKVETL